jgi:hypothetical protein
MSEMCNPCRKVVERPCQSSIEAAECKHLAGQRTPGPWKLDGRLIYSESTRLKVCGVNHGAATGYHDDEETMIANGRLLAAAPELLAALERLCSAIARQPAAVRHEAIQAYGQALAIIAKATEPTARAEYVRYRRMT